MTPHRAPHPRRHRPVLAAVSAVPAVVVSVSLMACTEVPATTSSATPATPATSATGGTGGAFRGLVDVGGGRSLFLDCQGDGAPTVFVIPGKGSYAEAWNVVVPPGDPVRSSPYDLITEARIVPSPSAVQPTVARTTRVCVYDRPGTRPDPPEQSTPVAQPHLVGQDVDDIVALLAAARLPGPLVLVAHSYGGLVLDLLARTHPDLVAGLVFVDPTSEFLPSLGTPAQNAAFARGLAESDLPGGEGIVAADAFARVSAAPPLPRVPSAVLTAGKLPPPAQLPPDTYSEEQIRRANELLAQSLGTTARLDADAGHSVFLYSPQLVADTITTIVRRLR